MAGALRAAGLCCSFKTYHNILTTLFYFCELLFDSANYYRMVGLFHSKLNWAELMLSNYGEFDLRSFFWEQFSENTMPGKKVRSHNSKLVWRINSAQFVALIGNPTLLLQGF